MSPEQQAATTVSIFGVQIDILVPIITFIAGVFVSRLSMSKKERKDHRAMLQEVSNRLSESLQKRFDEFVQAMHEYDQKEGNPTFNDFFNISTKGEAYFSQIKIICDSINSENIDKTSIKNTHAPIIKSAVEEMIPAYYETLKSIADKNAFNYTGEFKRTNYLSVIEVYEKYCQ